MIVASLLTTISAIAGDYGFRDFMIDKKKDFIALDPSTTVYSGLAPNVGSVVDYCAIEGGRLTKTITTDLGTEELKYMDDSNLALINASSKEEKINQLVKEKQRLQIKKDDTFWQTTMSTQNHRGIGGEFQCKNQKNVVLFKAVQSTSSDGIEHWLVSHKSEAMRDYANFSAQLNHDDSNMIGVTSYEGTSTDIKNKLSKKYSTYEAYFDDWHKGFLSADQKQKLGQNYRMSDSFKLTNKFYLNDSMGELSEVQYFCEGKGGEFRKDGQSFRSFLKQFYLDGANPVTMSYGYGTTSTSPLEGNYACVNTSESFTMQLKTPTKPDSLGFTLGYALIKKGGNADIQAQTTTNVPVQYTPSQDQLEKAKGAVMDFFAGLKAGNQQNGVNAGYLTKANTNMDDIGLVKNAVATKAPFGSQQGANVSLAQYNGKDQNGCDLVSVERSVANMPQSSRVHNYKVCGGQITSLGLTGLPGVPRKSELDPIIASVKQSCKQYGAFGTQYQDTVIACKTLDVNHCNLEITVMQNGKLLNKSVEKSCN